MIQVYFDSVGPKKALQVYTDGRLSRLVDFGYLPDGLTPDPAVTHSSIVKRFAAGEAIQNNAYPNEVFTKPPTEAEVAAQYEATHVLPAKGDLTDLVVRFNELLEKLNMKSSV